MENKILDLLLAPLEEYVYDFAVLIDGVEYLPMDQFCELFSDACSFMVDVIGKMVLFIGVVVAVGVLLIASVYTLFKAFTGRKKTE